MADYIPFNPTLYPQLSQLITTSFLRTMKAMGMPQERLPRVLIERESTDGPAPSRDAYQRGLAQNDPATLKQKEEAASVLRYDAQRNALIIRHPHVFEYADDKDRFDFMVHFWRKYYEQRAEQARHPSFIHVPEEQRASRLDMRELSVHQPAIITDITHPRIFAALQGLVENIRQDPYAEGVSINPIAGRLKLNPWVRGAANDRNFALSTEWFAHELATDTVTPTLMRVAAHEIGHILAEDNKVTLPSYTYRRVQNRSFIPTQPVSREAKCAIRAQELRAEAFSARVIGADMYEAAIPVMNIEEMGQAFHVGKKEARQLAEIVRKGHLPVFTFDQACDVTINSVEQTGPARVPAISIFPTDIDPDSFIRR